MQLLCAPIRQKMARIGWRTTGQLHRNAIVADDPAPVGLRVRYHRHRVRVIE
jgi:hypothetical protein